MKENDPMSPVWELETKHAEEGSTRILNRQIMAKYPACTGAGHRLLTMNSVARAAACA
jgi:hypothetical protein